MGSLHRLFLLCALVPVGACAEERPLRLNLDTKAWSPIIRPTLADRVPSPEKSPTLDPSARKRITLLVGGTWEKGGTKIEIGITPKIRRDLIHFRAEF